PSGRDSTPRNVNGAHACICVHGGMGEDSAELQPATLLNIPSLDRLDARERPNSKGERGGRRKAVENFWRLERALTRRSARWRVASWTRSANGGDVAGGVCNRGTSPKAALGAAYSD